MTRGARASWALCLCAAVLGGASEGSSASLLLPLKRTTLPPHAATAYHVRRRSLIGANASAQLELYGSVRDNGVFTVHLELGTPAQEFDVIVDTGSTLAYVPCQDCGDGCGRHEVR